MRSYAVHRESCAVRCRARCTYVLIRTLIVGLIITAAATCYFLLNDIVKTALIGSGTREVVHPIQPQMPANVCMTHDCNITAEWCLANMDASVDPCKNFYQFACGGFIKRATIPPDKETASTTVELEQKMKRDLDELLYNLPSENNGLSKAEGIVLKLYSQCMSVNYTSATTNMAAARRLISDAGGWPVDTGRLQANWSFQDLEKTLQNHCLVGNSLIKITVERSSSSDFRFVVEKPTVAKSRRRADLEQSLHAVVAAWGNTGIPIENIIDFEIALNKLLASREDSLFSTSYRLPELAGLPSLSWVDWPDLLRPLAPPRPAGADPALGPVFVKDPKYIDELHTLLKRTPSEDIANYMIYRTVENLMLLFSEDLRANTAILTGQNVSLRFHCLDVVMRNLGVSLSSMYIKRFVVTNIKQQAEEMVEEIRFQLEQDFNETTMINETTRAIMVDQVRSVALHIGYPDELLTAHNVDDYYAPLMLDNGSLVESVVRIRQWARSALANGARWLLKADVTTPQATFSQYSHAIVLSAGFLQPPLFSTNVPLYANYGATGYLAAHQLMHLTEDKIGVKEFLTDDIVYKGGFSLAYRVYNRKLDELKSPEGLLPGLHQFSQKQLFMLSMANTLCTKYQPEKLKKYNQSPMEKRLNAVVKSSLAFNEAFKCNR